MNDDMYYKLSKYYGLYSSKNNYINYAKFISKILKENRAKKILDVGCGSGEVLSKLGKEFFTIGIDKSPFQIKTAKKNYPLNKFICEDFLNKRFNNNFDAVIFIWNTILYFCPEENLLKALQKTHSILSDKGIILFDFSAFLEYLKEGKFKRKLIRIRKEGNLTMKLFSKNVPNIKKGVYTEITISKIYKNGKLVLEHKNNSVEINILSLSKIKKLLKKSGFEVIEILSSKSLKENKKINANGFHNYLVLAKKI